MSASTDSLRPRAAPMTGTSLAACPADLGAAPLGFRGRILAVNPIAGSLPPEELERRLVELGFVEGAMVELLHQGLFGADPIAVRVDGVTIALRRREAAAVLVEAAD
jgi:ferrous iron transport protein A